MPLRSCRSSKGHAPTRSNAGGHAVSRQPLAPGRQQQHEDRAHDHDQAQPAAEPGCRNEMSAQPAGRRTSYA
jgi:hypothetical protein